MDGKMIYAQSSDIKSRTYLEYRRDMKRKAIVELELLDWLNKTAKEEFKDQSLLVKKGGGDASIWFLRKGGITREADYIAYGKRGFSIELQYGSDISKNSIFDFKISKVAKREAKTRKRVPIQDLLFLYLFKDRPNLYCFLDPQWILKNSYKGVAPAWGNREVYKVSGKKILSRVKKSDTLENIWKLIKIKFDLLEFQHQLINITKENLSHLLQGVIDEKKLVKFIPDDLDSFFRICFILDNVNKIPLNCNIWLIYLFSLISPKNTTQDLFKIVYSIDFLYSKADLTDNEVRHLIEKTKLIFKILRTYEQKNGIFKSDKKLSPLDEIQYVLFTINLLEDISQDLLFYYQVQSIEPIKKIFQTLNSLEMTHDFIKDQLS